MIPRRCCREPPGGVYENGSRVFEPSDYGWNDSLPELHQINATLGVFLFNLRSDPYESQNLAETEPVRLQAMLTAYSQYAATAVMPLTFRYGFRVYEFVCIFLYE